MLAAPPLTLKVVPLALLSAPVPRFKVPFTPTRLTALVPALEEKLVNVSVHRAAGAVTFSAPPVVLLIEPWLKLAVPTFVPDNAKPDAVADVDPVDRVAARQHHCAVDQRVAAAGGFEGSAVTGEADALANRAAAHPPA